MDKVFVATEQEKESSCVYAYFAFELISIGVCKRDEGRSLDATKKVLERQVDFISTLPGIGVDNAIELRFVSHPVPTAPHLGRVDVLLRIRVSSGSEADAIKLAKNVARGIYPNLVAVDETYEWVAVVEKDRYHKLFDDADLGHMGEVIRREAWMRLDSMAPLPPRHSIGFIAQATPDEGVDQPEPLVHVVFPFVHTSSSLVRLFDILLLQQQKTVISIALTPTNLNTTELNYLVEQAELCEGYLNTSRSGNVPGVSSPRSPQKMQASLLLRQIQRTLFTLRDDCYGMKIQVAGQDALNASLMEAVGTVVTGPVATMDAAGDPSTVDILSGGYDWTMVNDETALYEASERLSKIHVMPGSGSLRPERGGRLRYLFDARQVNCGFRFPVPRPVDFPGVTSRSSKAVPPPVLLPTEGITVGENVYRGMRQPVHMLDDDRRRHTYIVGQTGTGKSSLLLNMIMQDIEAGKGVGVLDPHGELIDEVISRIPRHRVKDVYYINPENAETVVGLNMLHYRDEIDRDSAVNHLLEIFYRLYSQVPEAMGPAFEMYFRNAALLEMADAEKVPMLDGVLRVFSDKEYRHKQLEKCTDPLVKGFWDMAQKSTGDAGLENFAPYITNKLSRILYNKLIRRMLLQGGSTIDFEEILNGRRILLVDLCKGKLGDMSSSFLAMVISSMIQRAAFLRTTAQNKHQLADFYLYIDEFQNVATDSFVTILSEARKYRLNAILANQYVHQIPDDVREAVWGNVGTIISFRAGSQDAKLLEQDFAPTITRDDLMNLPNYQAYVKTLAQGEAIQAFGMRTVLNASNSDPEVVREIEQGVMRYGKPAQEVDASISERWATV